MDKTALDNSAIMARERPLVMGILNVTPDSFSDGGCHLQREKAVAAAMAMIEAGAEIIDIGGESTRPGAKDVSVDEELERVIPAIEAIRARTDTAISIDTSKPQVMTAAVAAGADMINDVRALRQPGALQTAAKLQVPVCLMHMQGEPRTMQADPRYDQLVPDLLTFFRQRIAACEQAGIARQKLWLDPGFGFGKTVSHNYQLLAGLSAFAELGLPLLVGISRKSMIGAATEQPVDQRLAGSLAAATLAAWQGAHIIRVHDVRETVDAMNVVAYCRRYSIND